jgi:hypothetical protein
VLSNCFQHELEMFTRASSLGQRVIRELGEHPVRDRERHQVERREARRLRHPATAARRVHGEAADKLRKIQDVSAGGVKNRFDFSLEFSSWIYHMQRLSNKHHKQIAGVCRIIFCILGLMTR